MLKCVNRFCQGMDMKLAVKKTVMLTSGLSGTSWKVTHDNPCVEAVLVSKYLGIDIQVKSEQRLREEDGGSCQKYANAVIGLSRNGLDRAVQPMLCRKDVLFQQYYTVQRQWYFLRES